MKKFIYKNRFYLTLTVIAAAALLWFVVMLSLGEGKPENIPSAEQADELVSDTLSSLPRSVSAGAKYIFNNIDVEVRDVKAGNDKNVFIDCTYTTPDVLGSLENEIPEIMGQAYEYMQKQQTGGAMVNATKISLYFSERLVSVLEDAPRRQGEITLEAYETQDGLSLYLSDDTVDMLSGGLISVSRMIKDTVKVEYDGQEIDIKNNNTLRTGVSDCIALSNYDAERPQTGNAVRRWWESFKDEFRRNFVNNGQWKYLANGLLTTLGITGLAVLIGIFIGFLVAVIRCTNESTGRLDAADKVCRIYLTVIRGTPVMVQLLIIYFVLLLPIGIEKFPAAVLCFGLNSGAYVAEIVRGGIMSVDRGQSEAGRSLGFSYAQTMIYFIIPQAFKAVLPALANEFITLLKESSVAFYIGVADLTQGGLKIRSITYSNFMPLIAVALIYLALVMILTRLVGILERRLRKSEH